MSIGFKKKVWRISRGERERVNLFLHPYGKALAASGATDDVIARNASKAQGAFAMRALAVDVGLSVPNAQKETLKGLKNGSHRAAEGGVLGASFCDVAREKSKEGIAEGKQIEGGEDKAEHAV